MPDYNGCAVCSRGILEGEGNNVAIVSVLWNRKVLAHIHLCSRECFKKWMEDSLSKIDTPQGLEKFS